RAALLEGLSPSLAVQSVQELLVLLLGTQQDLTRDVVDLSPSGVDVRRAQGASRLSHLHTCLPARGQGLSHTAVVLLLGLGQFLLVLRVLGLNLVLLPLAVQVLVDQVLQRVLLLTHQCSTSS